MEIFTQNQFEIFLKDDFIDIYLRPEYERSIATCCHHKGGVEEQKDSQIKGSP